MNMKKTASYVAGILCAALAGCSYLGIGITHIGDITANPSRFDGIEVRVKGKVVDVNKLPLVELKLYTLRDETGEITVIAGELLPALNSTAMIKAKVETVAIIQGQAMGLRLTEIEKLSY